MGIQLAVKRSGLKRDQVIYIERRGYLGVVVKVDGARRYSEAQLCKLERMAACLAAGLRLREASTIAAAGYRLSEEDRLRLHQIVMSKVAAIRRDLLAWEYVFSLVQAARDPDAGSPAA